MADTRWFPHADPIDPEFNDATGQLEWDADIVLELRDHEVTVVSLYPGLVRTENVLAAGVFDLSNSESPEFQGRAVVALASDPHVARWSGQAVVAAALAERYGFTPTNPSTRL